jgi:hypothetical protein
MSPIALPQSRGSHMGGAGAVLGPINGFAVPIPHDAANMKISIGQGGFCKALAE